MLAMEVKVATHIGQVRENNEDSYWVGPNCLAVCDGMGGHQAGEVASRLAAEIISSYPFKGENPGEEVRAAIEKAHKLVGYAASREQRYRGMGTTATLACITTTEKKATKITVGHVGDSRAYLFYQQELHLLTSDHSVVGELIRTGTITSVEAKNHAKRHVLTQVLGSGQIEIELVSKTLEEAAILLLCTDGLTDVVEEERIKQILEQAHKFKNVAQELVDLANTLGGPDNITVIVAQLS